MYCNNRVNVELNKLHIKSFLVKKYNISNYYKLPEINNINLILLFKVVSLSLNKKYLLNLKLLEFISGQKVSIYKIKYIYYLRKRYIVLLYKVVLRKKIMYNFLDYFVYSILPEYNDNNLKKSIKKLKLDNSSNIFQIHFKDMNIFEGLDDIFYNLKNYIHIQFCIKNISKRRLNFFRLLRLN